MAQNFRYILIVFAVLVQKRCSVPQHDQTRVTSLATGSQPSPVRMNVDRKYRHAIVSYPGRFQNDHRVVGGRFSRCNPLCSYIIAVRTYVTHVTYEIYCSRPLVMVNCS